MMMHSSSNQSLTNTFKFSIFYRRCSQYILTIAFLQYVFVLGGVAILKLGQSPLRILDIWQVFISLTNWLYILILSASAVAICFFHIHKYSVTHEVLLTKWEIIWKIIRPSSLLSILFIFTISGVIVRCYLGLLDDSFSHLLLVSKDSYCLNEQHTFVVLHGVYSGMYYGFFYNLFSKNEISFEIIQQPKHLQVNFLLPKLIYESFVSILHKLKWFYIIYYFFGSYARMILMDLLHVNKCCGDVALNSFSGLLDFEMFWISWVTSSLVYFIWDFAANLLAIYLAEHHTFPVDSRMMDDNIISLPQALGFSDVPLVQYLGFLDLYVLSRNSPERRKQVYSLSHPGGHAYNWKSVCNECLSMLDNFVNLLNSSNNDIMSNSSENPKKSSNSLKPKINPATPHQRDFPHSHNLPTKDYSHFQKPLPPALVINRWCVRKLNEQISRIQNWFAMLHLFRKNKSCCSRYLLANCQPHIWAVRAISFLSVFSILEDKYGVVQQDLSDIISILCDLHQAVEKKQKWITRTNRLISLQWDIKYTKSLLSETKRALCKLGFNFHNYLDSIKMSADHRRMLEQYANYEQ